MPPFLSLFLFARFIPDVLHSVYRSGEKKNYSPQLTLPHMSIILSMCFFFICFFRCALSLYVSFFLFFFLTFCFIFQNPPFFSVPRTFVFYDHTPLPGLLFFIC